MKKFVKAKLNDKLQDVYFLYGFEINDNFPLNDKTKDYIFQFDNHKYFGSHLDYWGKWKICCIIPMIKERLYKTSMSFCRCLE